MIDTIVRAVDGTYIDLSRVVAILPVEELPHYFGGLYGYDVMFLPEGIPFKQDQTFSVTISKRFGRPPELRREYTEFGGITDKGREILESFNQKCIAEMELSRESLANQWRGYRKQV